MSAEPPFELVSAYRANGSLVTVPSDRYASRAFLCPNYFGTGLVVCSHGTPACGGSGLKARLIGIEAYFESNESTLFPKFLG